MTTNLARANTRVKQLVSHAFREVAAQPDTPNAPKYLRSVAKGMRALAASVPVTKAAIKSESWPEQAERGIAKLDRIVDNGFDYAPIKATDDARLQKLGSTQMRNTVGRPVNFLKPIKDALNAPTPKWDEAAERIERMADSLDVGLKLSTGDLRGAKRMVSSLQNNGYVPSSVVRHVLN